jgi:uncharacterized protein (TIGR02246 family)
MSSVVEDRDEIRQLIARYCHLVDTHQTQAWVSLFSEDALLVIGDRRTQGHDALTALCNGLVALYEKQPMRHVVDNVVVDVDGDVATAQSYLQIVSPGSPPVFMQSGRYHDQLRRADGRWVFTERYMEPDITS